MVKKKLSFKSSGHMTDVCDLLKAGILCSVHLRVSRGLYYLDSRYECEY